MGLTWLFGFFAIEDAEFVFSLIFCLCNSFQGVVIFVLFCACQDDVKTHLRPYCNRICCNPINNIRRLSETASTGFPSGHELGSKTPFSGDVDQFTPVSIETVSSGNFESTNQPTVLSEIAPDVTVSDENENDTKKQTKITSIKVRDPEKKPRQLKRRIFSIYEIFFASVGDTGEQQKELDLHQKPALDIKEEEKKGKEEILVERNKGENDVSQDEDMLVAPIEIENAIKDAHVEIDKD